MYIVEVKTNKGLTCTKTYKRPSYAKRCAAKVANAGTLYLPNPELWPWENWYGVRSVRLYNTDNPTADIDF